MPGVGEASPSGGRPLDNRSSQAVRSGRRKSRTHVTTRASPRRTCLRHRAEAAAARRLDDEHVARLHLDLAGRAELFPRAIGALDPVAPTAPGAPPAMPNGGTRRWLASTTAVIASRKRMRRREPSPPRCLPSPPLPCRMPKDSSRTGKRHSSTSGSVRRELVMWVCTTLDAVESRARAGAARDRLVVLVRVVAEREIVHRALRRREHAQRAVERIGHDLADVSTLPATTAAG